MGKQRRAFPPRLASPLPPRYKPAMSPILSIAALTKKYASGLVALDEVDLTIDKGEIFALLGPNGAGKTTLIGVVCGIVSVTSGRVSLAGHDIIGDYRAARSLIG